MKKRLIKLRGLAGTLAVCMLINSMPVTVAAEGETPEGNLAYGALVAADCTNDSGNQTIGYDLVDGIIDGKNGIIGEKAQDIVVTFNQERSFNKLVLYSSYAKNQGPTKFDIAVTTDGENWITVAKDVTTEWQYDNDTVENKSIVIMKQEQITGIKLSVREYANTWNHFYMKDLQVYDDMESNEAFNESKSELDELLLQAKTEVSKTSEYSEASCMALNRVIAEAEAEGMLYDDAIANNIQKLQEAIAGLKKLDNAKSLTVSENCTGGGKYGVNETATVTAPYDAANKKAFIKWEAEGLDEEFIKENQINLSQNPLVFPMPDHDVTLTAVYENQKISSQVVKGENGKDYLEVGGTPWLYTFVQNMGKWERMGHQEEFKENSGNPDPNYPTAELPLSFLENMYEKTAYLNYSTISQALMWRDIETEPGVYDFNVIDQYVAWAKKYNMKLDLAWFGSACQSGTRIPNLSSGNNGDGRKVDLGYQYTAPWWYVKTQDGNQIDTYYELWGAGSVTYNLWVTGDNAEYMKQREYYALQALFNHLAEIDQDNTVISIQIENEPNMRDHGWTELTQWMNYLGKAVKESGYVVATRLNFAGSGYSVNANTLDYIDFVGPDPYTQSVSNIKSIINNGEQNSTLTYIAENSGNYTNLSSLTTAALTAGGFYGTWALDNWFCDGGGGHFNGPHSLYENTSDYSTRYYNWKLGTIPGMTSQAKDIMHYNKGMNKMGKMIAKASSKEMQSFNVESDNPEQNYDKVKKIGDYKLGYQAEDASVALAVVDGQNLYVTSDTAEKVKVLTLQKPLQVTAGEIGNDGKWTGNVREVKQDAKGRYYVELAAEECICLEMPQAQEFEDKNLALSAKADSTNIGNGSSAANVNDDDETTGLLSKDNPSFPQYITLKWDNAKTFDEVIVSGSYAQDQALKNWDIEVSEDGENNWTKVASAENVEWKTNNGNTESRSITFERQTDKKGLRIKINDANLKWKHYFVTELQVYNSEEPMDPPVLADKTELQKLYEENVGREQGNYTEESWQIFQNALKMSQSVIENTEATQDIVDNARNELQNAIDALQEVPNQVILEKIQISAAIKTEYRLNEELDLTGMKVEAVYSDGSVKDVTSEVKIEGYDAAKEGRQKVSIVYEGKREEFFVTVTADEKKKDEQVIDDPPRNDQNINSTGQKNESDVSTKEESKITANSTKRGNETIANSTKRESRRIANPKTGDNQNIILITVVMILSVVVMIGSIARRRKTRK